MKIENFSINTARSLGLSMIDEANSGHPGIVLGAAPILYTLFTKHMVFNPRDPRWVNRDRFVMAAGHGSALYYSMLHLVGYDISINDLKKFRKIHSKTPGHPEFTHTAGVDATSGPLGQGIAMATGMAMSEEFLRSKYSLIDHYTYVLCGDGDLQEGVTQEAMSFAGHQGLNKLVVLYDSNDIQLDSSVKTVNSENVKDKYEAMNWHYILVKDGSNIEEIDAAIKLAKAQKSQPSIIEVKTIIGLGSKVEGTSASHGSPLGSEETSATLKKLGYEGNPFEVDQKVYDHFEKLCTERCVSKYDTWSAKLSKLSETNYDQYEEFNKFLKHDVVIDYEKIYRDLKTGNSEATRNLGGSVLNLISNYNTTLLAGSADLSGSTKVKGLDGNFDQENRSGRNINYGVREHAMAAIANGLVLHSYVDAIVSGFLIFSDYSKPAIRLSALMNIPTIYVFTHDSIAVGEDGPTHEPVEQLISLRSIPNLDVFRPADLHEVVASYKIALEKQNPSAIILSRQNLPDLSEYTYNKGAIHGGYNVIEFENPDGIIMASGSELSLAIEVSNKLKQSNVYYNVVSMLSIELFNMQSQEYIDQILLPHIRKRVAIEMGSAYSWHQFVGLDGLVFSVDKFGLSGPADEIMEEYGFERDNIVYEIKKLSTKGVE